MGIVRLLIEKNDVRYVTWKNSNNVLNFLSSLINVPIFKKHTFPKCETNYNILKKNWTILVNRANEGLQKLIQSIATVFWKGRKWKGTYWPSKWKWYHRHGYWATRKKLLSFDKYRPYRMFKKIHKTTSFTGNLCLLRFADTMKSRDTESQN
ncbi:conserved Plasmodium protein, unknown function (PCAS_091160:exon:5) [Plasmodium ovale wallikeri]|uniref:Uncharacterized protein n=1 Tax=Plasmodium ovale wallikeri TaxID=864142 RepID=A0A1A8YUF9_PLAOA|nr:conserved Plasmodium protein, unknown function (PCAS_091160:exon:5) [Plasmodium ovale wallikeri]SBT35496.1 conserved Plasmodium protein, unknown function (PCAS_091160:exon:5) [Plasmodium ovale wallikeri]